MNQEAKLLNPFHDANVRIWTSDEDLILGNPIHIVVDNSGYYRKFSFAIVVPFDKDTLKRVKKAANQMKKKHHVGRFTFSVCGNIMSISYNHNMSYAYGFRNKRQVFSEFLYDGAAKLNEFAEASKVKS